MNDIQSLPIQIYACIYQECGKIFAERSNLIRHVHTHAVAREKSFTCPQTGCGKTFTRRSSLTIHIRGHTGERPFVCTHAVA